MTREKIVQYVNEFQKFSLQDQLNLEEKVKSQPTQENIEKYLVFCLWRYSRHNLITWGRVLRILQKINFKVEVI